MEGREFIPSPKEGMTLEEFYVKIKELQAESTDPRFQAMPVEELGEEELGVFQKFQEGVLTDEELIAKLDDAPEDTSRKSFYYFLSMQVSDAVFDKRLEKEQS